MNSSRYLCLEKEKMPDLTEICQKYGEDFTETARLWSDPSECIQEPLSEIGVSVSADLEDIDILMDAFRQQWFQLTRIEGLEKEILLLRNRCDNLERTAPVIVPIESFAPEPYDIIKPFHVVVKFYEDQYIASFFDANLSASGGTPEEAVFNLKDMLIETFDILNELEDDKLGIGPRQQKAILKEFLARRTNGGNNERDS